MTMTRYSHLLQELFQENMKNHDNEYVFGIISRKEHERIEKFTEKRNIKKNCYFLAINE